MNAARARALALALAAGAAACHTVQVDPFTGRPERAALEKDERKLWEQADEFDRAVAGSRWLDRDEELRAYLQGVLDALQPAFAGAMRVEVLDSPVVNAFTLPNGTIYVHTGILSYFGNEAQLAALLGHESAHFTQRHALERRTSAENASLFALFGGLALPIGADLLALSSYSGFSQDTEREADRLGFDCLVRAGYDPAEAAQAFRRLLANARAEGEEAGQPFFASHPALEERIESFGELARTRPGGGERGEERYLARTALARRQALEADLERLKHGSVLAALEVEDTRISPARAAYYRGEAYRMRAQSGDLERAEQAFRQAIALDPVLAPPERALGRLCLRSGRAPEAREHLQRYLVLAGDAPDRAYVEAELKGIPP